MSISDQTLKATDIINLIFGVIAGICLIILFSFMFSGTKNLDILQNSQNKKVGVNLELKSFKKPIQYYERILSRRRLFLGQGLSETNKPASINTEQFNLRFSDLQLLGVVSGAKGPQAIINDAKTDQSYYCSGNEEVGGFYVKEVLPNKVILELNGEKLELRL
ncbi:MAG: type II secretion system protein N [Candidatus Omnitrophota bacterium]